MTLGDWCDAAWSAVLDDAPVLANPAEYRTMVYEAFWLGNAPTPKPATPTKPGEKPAPPRSKPTPRSALAELQAEAARIAALQAEKAAAE